MISESDTLGVREFKGEAKDMATKKKLSATGTRVLAVKLTEEEKRLRGDELAQAEIERDDLEVTFKLTAATFRGERRQLTDTIMRLARILEAGEESQEVKCEESLDFATKKITLRRLDTKAIVSTRDASEEELQGVLAFEIPPEEQN